MLVLTNLQDGFPALQMAFSKPAPPLTQQSEILKLPQRFSLVRKARGTHSAKFNKFEHECEIESCVLSKELVGWSHISGEIVRYKRRRRVLVESKAEWRGEVPFEQLAKKKPCRALHPVLPRYNAILISQAYR